MCLACPTAQDRRTCDTLSSYTQRMAEPMPKSCKRFSKRMPMNARFLAHLPTCEASKAVLAYLQRDLELRNFLHKSRN